MQRHPGPGLLKSAYETCLAYELQKLGLSFEQHRVLLPVYKEMRLDQGYRVGLLVKRKAIAELKVVERIALVHETQVLSHLRFSGCRQ